MQTFDWPIFPHGGDYNPDQWPKETWIEDARLMQLANVNIATVPVFGWDKLEPEEGRYEFAWLDEVIDLLWARGVHLCLATSTASQPAWVDQKYPDVLVTRSNGQRARHGNRHSFCPHSPNYRRLSTALARALAERYGKHPALVAWHVNNEYGTHCYCDLCAEAFRGWLREKYGDLKSLNAAWSTAFWAHTYTNWEQVEPPYAHGEGSIQALKLDWMRFMSDSLLGCYLAEAEVLRKVTPAIPVTTNLMGTFFDLDYRRWAPHLDFASWDSYPRPNASPGHVAFLHQLMAGLKEGQPFWLMEQSPSQQNWQPYNRVKPPGVLRAQSFQAVAHGADSVMYFQWRRGRGGIEKLHGAVVEHGGDERNRVFQEVSALGAELKKLHPGVQNCRVPARAAVIFDWESWWAMRFSSGPNVDLDYVNVVNRHYEALHALGVPTLVLGPEADLSDIDLVVAPMLTMLSPRAAESIRERVAAGATLIATPFTAFVDPNDRVFLEGAPGPWRDLLGIWVEESDAMLPGMAMEVEWDGWVFEGHWLCDRVRLEGAEVLANYTKEFYAGEPALTRNTFGKGRAYYAATFLDPPGLRTLMERACGELWIGSPLAGGAAPPEGIEVSVRQGEDGRRYLFLISRSDAESSVALPDGEYFDVLNGELVGAQVALNPGDVRVLSPRASG